MQFKGLLSWILISSLFSLVCHCPAGSTVSLTVEGGVSLVGPHCPGTVRLFCEGVDLAFLAWTYNGVIAIIDKINLESDQSMTMIPANPAFVSVNVSNISRGDNNSPTANYLSFLTVDLLELQQQNITNITCGDLKDKNTQLVDITRKESELFTANITASYQSGALNRIEVNWTKLPPACSEYDPLSVIYQINFTGHELDDDAQAENCVNTSCLVVFTGFPESVEEYDLMIVAANQSHPLQEFNLTIAYHRENYFVWTVDSINCQYSVQCAPTLHTVNNTTSCTIRHTTDHGTLAFFPATSETHQHFFPYISPGTVHHFELMTMVEDHLLITEGTSRVEPPQIESRMIAIIAVTLLFFILALIHLVLILLKAFCKGTSLATKKEAHIISAILLLMLVLICVALLFAYGIMLNDNCSSNHPESTLQNSLLNAMVVVACLGIVFVLFIWSLMIFGSYKYHQKMRSSEGEGHSFTGNSKSTESARNLGDSINNYCYYQSSLQVATSTMESRHQDMGKKRKEMSYDTLEHSNEHHLQIKQQENQNQTYQYAALNKETMLTDPKAAGHYMQLRPGERSKPVPNLSDSAYSRIEKRAPEPAAATVPDIVDTIRIENKDYDVLEQSLQVLPSTGKMDETPDSLYDSIDLADVKPSPSEAYIQLRPGEKSKPVPNLNDPNYSHVLATVEEESPAPKAEKKSILQFKSFRSRKGSN